jgi:Spy/CpxP family protein refolding chaperone
MEIVAKDPKENQDQKSAMIQGLQRIQRTQIYMVLTPEQQSEFRKKIRAQRAADQDARKMQHGPQPR